MGPLGKKLVAKQRRGRAARPAPNSQTPPPKHTRKPDPSISQVLIASLSLSPPKYAPPHNPNNPPPFLSLPLSLQIPALRWTSGRREARRRFSRVFDRSLSKTKDHSNQTILSFHSYPWKATRKWCFRKSLRRSLKRIWRFIRTTTAVAAEERRSLAGVFLAYSKPCCSRIRWLVFEFHFNCSVS